MQAVALQTPVAGAQSTVAPAPTEVRQAVEVQQPRKRVYLAGPLFSEPERLWCQHIKARLETEAYVDVLWPWDMVEAERPRWEVLAPGPRQVAIAEICRTGIDQCDILVALLDTIPSDDGTIWEMGYLWGSRGAACRQVPVFGLRTDTIRFYGDSEAPLNAMVGSQVFLFGKLCITVDELVAEVLTAAAWLRLTCLPPS
jgi:nucleoside 2-deoxyribosyltransferase